MAVQRSGRHKRWGVVVSACGVVLGGLSWSAQAIVSSNTFLPIQQIVGADRFYNEGYYGFGVVVANVEAGHVWDQHEVFTTPVGPGVYQVQDPSLDTAFTTTQYDSHATAVGSILTGIGPFQPGIGYYYYQFGMAPGASLISSAIATDWVGNTGEFNISTKSFNSGYTIPMRDGVPIEIFGKGTGLFITLQADVVNSSWGFDDPAGTSQESMTIDSLIGSHRQTVCLAAGNHDAGSPQVVGPGSGYNTITVGALASDQDNPPYRTIATFSNVGPNDFHNPKLNLDISAVRAAVDIMAPGQDIVAAAYTGSTGSNTGQTDPYPSQNNLYYVGIAGTSFASPTVAGGAALMVGAARDRLGAATKATDTLIVKAILLNSADKIPGWTNNTTSVNGVLVTTQGLDYSSGAGAMNLNRAFDQEFAGNTDLTGLGGGAILRIGWDYGHVAIGAPNDYIFSDPLAAGEMLTATLDWLIHRTFDATTGESAESYFNDLDLQLWSVKNGQLDTLIAESSSMYNNVEHLYLAIPSDGDYALRVLFFANTFDVTPNGDAPPSEDFGLAWQVPEPGAMVWVVGVVMFGMRRKRRSALRMQCGNF